jgi:hypothetical protein
MTCKNCRWYKVTYEYYDVGRPVKNKPICYCDYVSYPKSVKPTQKACKHFEQ